jgi:hypothetical protein
MTTHQQKRTPLLFNDPMVLAIIAGTKKQTRRLVSQRELACLAQGKDAFGMSGSLEDHLGAAVFMSTPVGLAGDLIWVREAWAPFSIGQKHDLPCSVDDIEDADGARYRADGSVWMCSDTGADICTHKGGEFLLAAHRWRPSIHMPAWACRLVLEVVSVRVERVQAITDSDAREEGVVDRDAFRVLWSAVYGQQSWDSNPFVWVIKFKKEKP